MYERAWSSLHQEGKEDSYKHVMFCSYNFITITDPLIRWTNYYIMFLMWVLFGFGNKRLIMSGGNVQ